MRYKTYKTWYKNVVNDDTDYKTSDARVKGFLSTLAQDDIARKMLGLRMLQHGVINEPTLNVLMLRTLTNYL